MSNAKRPYQAPAITIEGTVEELTLAQITGTHLDGFYQQPDGTIVPDGQQVVGAVALGS